MLRCPKCKERLYKQEQSYRCVHHHTYNIARRGYIHMLLANRKATGDDKAMVKARTCFLSGGYYVLLCNTLINIVQGYAPKVVVDAGCGEGYYTNKIKDRLLGSTMFGFDLSKYAVDEACKERCNITYAVCSVFQMPLEDACIDMVLSVFSPFAIHEVHRVLKKGGIFIKVGPGAKHLIEMKQVLYEHAYDNVIDNVNYEELRLIKEECVKYSININNKDHIQALFQMTPYYWKSPKKGSERLQTLDELQTKVQFHIAIYEKYK